MRATISIGAIIVAVAVLSCERTDGTAVARLSADGEEHAPVFVSEKVHGVFYVENVGTDPFRIESVKSTCVCTTVVETREKVAPGERAEIRYDMVSAAPRPKSVGVLVQTSPPLDEPLRFTTSGTWMPVMELDTGESGVEVDFGEPIERVIALHAVDDAGPIRVTGAKSRHAWAEVALMDPAPGELPRLLLRSHEVIQPGTRELGIALDFERQEPGRQDVTLEVHVRSDFTIAPSPLMVDIDPGQTNPTVELTVRNESGTPFLPRSIRAQGFSIVTPTLPDTPEPAHVIAITMDLQEGSIPRLGRLYFDVASGKGELGVDVFFSESHARP
jgi:hypothetical protein